jgi:sugar lactone lactonase YvrE
MTRAPARIRARSLISALALLGVVAFFAVGAARALAIPPSIIIGLNDGSGWGSPDSAKFHEHGFTSERIEAGGPYTTIKESSELGWKNDMVIVGNTNDETLLGAINVAEWTKETVAQIKEQMTYGVTLFEVGNEMFLKGYCGEGCYQQKEPAKYAEMFVSLSKALETEKITGAKLLFDSYGDYETSNGGSWSQVCCGGGWLATAAKAQPELLKRVSGFTMHPYGEAGGNQENDWGPGALKVEHEQAVSLGFEHTDYYATEFGVKLNEGGTSGSSSLANQAERITAVYTELIGFGYVKGIWYYQTHDDGSGKWGLIEPQAGGESPFEPRPALEAVANFALTYEGPDTEAATSITSSGAKLNGSINPEGSETHYHFEYGTSKMYGTSVPSVEASVGSGTAGVEESQTITGLAASTTYHYRLVAKRGSWTVDGVDHTFTTSSSVPANTALPVISPTAPIVGIAESSTTGTWTNSPTSYSYQWKRCNAAGAECTNISGATSSSYTPVEADIEHTLLVAVTATNGGGSSTPASSAASSLVKAAGWLSMAPVYSSSFGSAGSGSGQFNHPGDVAVDAKGNLWVIDFENSRIEEFNEKGEYVKAFGSLGSGSGQLKRPCSLALDSKGNVWVADAGNERIEEFNEKGEYVKVFGTPGSGAGQIGEAEGVAVDSHGNVWVADTYSGRVEVFNEKGEYLKTVGSAGSGTGQFGEPQDLAFDAKGDVWVDDWTYSRVDEFNEKGEYLRRFGTEGSGNGQLMHPYGIAVEAGGNVLVADNGNDRVDVFNEKGEYETRFGSAGSGTAQFTFNWPIGVTVDTKGDVWVTDPGNARIQKWVAPSSPPTYIDAFGSSGSGAGQFSHPGDVTADRKGNLWVIDHGNNRIEEFNEKGEYVKAIGSAGSGTGQLSGPTSLAIDEAGNVWVADTGNSRIEEFNEKGEYVKVFGTVGSGTGQMQNPEGIVVGPHWVWVADTYNGRVEQFNEKGEYQSTIGSKGSGAGQIGEPQDLALDGKGDLYVADWPNSRIEEFTEKGEYVREFASEGSGNGQLSHPYGIVVDSGGNVWVADNGNDRVEVFSEKGEYETKFGSAGTGAGQFGFSYPIGLTLDGKGDVWVTDPGNSRIQEWVR